MMVRVVMGTLMEGTVVTTMVMDMGDLEVTQVIQLLFMGTINITSMRIIYMMAMYTMTI